MTLFHLFTIRRYSKVMGCGSDDVRYLFDLTINITALLTSYLVKALFFLVSLVLMNLASKDVAA